MNQKQALSEMASYAKPALDEIDKIHDQAKKINLETTNSEQKLTALIQKLEKIQEQTVKQLRVSLWEPSVFRRSGGEKYSKKKKNSHSSSANF